MVAVAAELKLKVRQMLSTKRTQRFRVSIIFFSLQWFIAFINIQSRHAIIFSSSLIRNIQIICFCHCFLLGSTLNSESYAKTSKFGWMKTKLNGKKATTIKTLSLSLFPAKCKFLFVTPTQNSELAGYEHSFRRTKKKQSAFIVAILENQLFIAWLQVTAFNSLT